MRQYKQSNMWNIDIRSIKAWEKKLNKQICESRNEIKKKKTKIKAFGLQLVCTRTSLHAHNQACVHRLDYAYASFCPKNPKSTTKIKTLNLTP